MAGQKALADGGELPLRPRAGTGAKAVRAGFGPHGVAVTDTILAFGGRGHLTDWQVEVNHAIEETGPSFNTDAVLAWPTQTSEVRLFEPDNGSMCQARLAKEVWDYERYAGHRVWEGVRGTIGGTYPFWQRHRCTRSKTFPRLHVVLAGKEKHLLDNPPPGARRRREGHRRRGVGEHPAAAPAGRALVRDRRRRPGPASPALRRASWPLSKLSGTRGK